MLYTSIRESVLPRMKVMLHSVQDSNTNRPALCNVLLKRLHTEFALQVPCVPFAPKTVESPFDGICGPHNRWCTYDRHEAPRVRHATFSHTSTGGSTRRSTGGVSLDSLMVCCKAPLLRFRDMVFHGLYGPVMFDSQASSRGGINESKTSLARNLSWRVDSRNTVQLRQVREDSSRDTEFSRCFRNLQRKIFWLLGEAG